MEESLLNEIKEATSRKDKSVDVYNLLPILSGTQFESSLSKQIAGLHDVMIQKEQELFEVTPSSGRVTSLNEQITIQRKILSASVLSLQRKINNRKDNLQARISEIEGTFSGLPAKELLFSRLKRSFAINEKFYTLLIEKKAEYSITKAGIVPESTILEVAESPRIPTSPVSSQVLLVCLSLALIISVFLVLIRYVLFNDISSIGEIVRLTQSPIGNARNCPSL